MGQPVEPLRAWKPGDLRRRMTILALALLVTACGTERRGGMLHAKPCEDHACPEMTYCENQPQDTARCVSGCSTDPDSCAPGLRCESDGVHRFCVDRTGEGEGEGSAEGEGEGRAEGEGEGRAEGEGEGTGCGDLPMTQPASAPCCVDYGIDACGANLFCAAFDGRRQATCYVDRSRVDGTECNADGHCASGSCNPAVRRCRSLPGAACLTTVGCAGDGGSSRYVCADEGTCQRATGHPGAPCAEDQDCEFGDCVELRCRSGLGEPCGSGEDCTAGQCLRCYYSNVFCTSEDSGNECLQPCSDDSYRVSCR